MRAIEFVLEAEQRMMEPELYEDVPNSILKRAVQAAMPGVKLDFRTTPEGYLNVSNDDDSVRLDIGMSIYDSELSFNVENAYLNKHAKGGVMTNIIANAFALAEKKYGIPRARSLSIEQDRSHGAWQHIANKLGLEYSAHQIDENFADGKVKGKSRPGRVKKAGASCSGSVTSLRQKAKQGGERGKMYHWCANMKSGRNKTNESSTTKTFHARVKLPNQSTIIDTMVVAQTYELAKRLLKAQYGASCLVSNVREVK